MTARAPHTFETLARLATAGDPCALLGVPAGAPREVIIDALKSALDVIANHHDADARVSARLRLHLHAAAAQLLMPTLGAVHAPPPQRTLTGSPPRPFSVAPPPADPAPGGSAPAVSLRFPAGHQPASQASPAILDAPARDFRERALLILAMHGGWNRSSLHRLRLLAMSLGIAPAQCAQALAALTNRPVPALVPALAAPPTLAVEALDPVPDEHPIDPGAQAHQRRSTSILVGVGAAVAALLLLAVGLRLMRGSGPVTPTIAGTDARTPIHADPPAPPPAQTVAKPSPPPPVEFATLPARLSTVAQQLRRGDPGAMGAFADAQESAAMSWARGTPQERTAVAEAIVECLYRVSNDQPRSLALLGGLAPGKPAPGSDVWSAGVLARLSQESNLPQPVRSRIQELLTAHGVSVGAGGEVFRSGALARVRSLAERLPPVADASPPGDCQARWEAIAASANALGASGTDPGASPVLALIEQVFAAPQQLGRLQARAWAIDALAGGVDWSLPWARSALLRWLTSPAHSTSDLNILFAALVRTKAAQGIDASFSLSAAATQSDRAALRTRIAQMWAINDNPVPRERWSEAARSALSEPPASDPVAALLRSVRLARLNALACRLGRGETDGVEADLAATPAPFASATSAIPAIRYEDIAARDAGWAIAYFAAGYDIPRRREMLARAATLAPGGLSIPEARVLVSEATRGAPWQVRADARRALRSLSRDPAVLLATLDLAPFIPPTKENSTLAETISGATLPRPDAAEWRTRLRSALVLAALERFSSDEARRIDLAMHELAAAYDLATPNAPAAPGNSPQSTLPEPALPARRAADDLAEQRKHALGEATGAALHAAPASRAALRRVLARPGPQAFAAEQAAMSDALQELIAAEHPARAARRDQIVREAQAQLRGAGHVFTQIEAREVLNLRLALLRLEDQP